MNKEIKDRLDKLENELKESKNEIHSLKSSVSLTIERGIRNLLSRFTRRQIILGSVIALFLISIIGIAGTVTKTYTFSSGEVVSASKFNTNFDTLFTLVNGNLDDSNISGISGSKITSGTVAAARLDNLSGSKITSGTIAAARIDNLDGSKITSGTVAAARIDNLSASMITSGTIDGARIDNLSFEKINNDQIVLFTTFTGYGGQYGASEGNLGGRTGADSTCNSRKSYATNHLCNNVRALISVDANDEIRDMLNNYSIPASKKIYDRFNNLITDNFSELISDAYFKTNIGGHLGTSQKSNGYWSGSDKYGALSDNCNSWTSNRGDVNGKTFQENALYFIQETTNCGGYYHFICICY